MLDPKFIRDHADLVRKNLEKRNSTINLDHFLILDDGRRKMIAEVDTLRAQQNEASDKVAMLQGGEREALIEKMKQLKETVKEKESELDTCEKEYQELLLSFPNMLADDVPVGGGELENKVIRSWGTPRIFDFTPLDHIVLGEMHGLIDMERASKVSGSRFTYLKGKLALLQFAVIQYTFSVLTNEKTLKEIADSIGYSGSTKAFIPVIPPFFIRPEVYAQMARLEPKEERYYIASDDQYLIGSAEHTLGPLHMNEILEEKDLPLRYVGYSTSFRREAGSYGKDMRGILRLHQFDKIEMETFSKKEDSLAEQNFIVAIQEYLIRSLGIPYQVMMICTGDMGTHDARQIDMECWIPSQNTYRETHTSDLMTDYQSRRLNTRVKRTGGNEFVHMNDATAFAIGRILIAIMENYQTKSGNIEIPEALRPFAGFETI